MSYLYQNIIFKPLYNLLVGIMDVIPGIDLGIAIIIFTVVIRFILYPLAKSSLLTQARMKEIEPETARIKAQYTNDKQTQALKIMELYKEKKIKPFSSILLLFIQLPILFALISVFYKITPTINPDFLYPVFLGHNIELSPTLLGLDLTQKSLILSVLTAIAQFLQLHFSIASRQIKAQKDDNKRKNNNEPLDKAAQFSASMTSQMKVMLPILAFASTYWLIPSQFPQAAAIIALYWMTGTLFHLGQELYIKKKYIDNKEVAKI